jgi:hypothetical protein
MLAEMLRKSPFTKRPTVFSNVQKNENKGLSNEEYSRKYSHASTVSFNEAMGNENNDENDKFNNAPLGIYTPGAGSKASHLIPHIGNVRRPNHLTRPNLKNKANAKTHAEVYTPYLNALTERKPSDPFYTSPVKRSGPTKAQYVLPPLPAPTVNNWTRKNRKNSRNRRASRRRC